MALLATNVIQEVLSELGKTVSFKATGGSNTTAANSLIGNLPEQPDDNYSTDYTVFVAHDAGDAGVAPEGEWGIVSAYNSTTFTHTFQTLTTAVASGDLILLANNDIPVWDAFKQLNNALVEIGDIDYPDTSLTSASSQTEYTFPVALKRSQIRSVEYQGKTGDSDDNQWIAISDYDVGPSAPGSTGLLYLPQLPSGRTIRVVYRRSHPELTAYNSPIAEVVTPRLVKAGMTAHCLQWLNGNSAGKNDYWLQRENKAWVEFQGYKAIDVPYSEQKHPKYFTTNKNRRRYPGDQSIYYR